MDGLAAGWATAMAAEVAVVASRPVFGLCTADLVATVEAIELLSARLTVVSSECLRELGGRDFARSQGASSLRAWLQGHLRLSFGEAKRRVALGVILDAHPTVTAGMVAGGVSAEQAAVIGRAVDRLPTDVDPQVPGQAAVALVAMAARFAPEQLGGLGESILGVVAPAVAEEDQRRRFEQAEARARRDRAFTVGRAVEGLSRVSGWLDVEAATVVGAALEPWSKPWRGDDGPDLRSPGQRRADALVEVCRLSLRSGELPTCGGEPPQVTVTMSLDSLRAGVGAGSLDTGEVLPAAAVRRLACDAKIIPVVLGGDGAVLDVGRTQRLFTGSLRRAVVLRDGGCAFPGCDRPPKWCDGHHLRHWCDGGVTSLANAVLLCGFHHRVIHRGDWVVRLGPDGFPEFIPPMFVDPRRAPRRNRHHRRNNRFPGSTGLAGPGKNGGPGGNGDLDGPDGAGGKPPYPRRT